MKMPDGRDLIGAIDIGGTKVAIGLATSEGRIISRRSIRTDSLPSGALALDAIESELRVCLQEAAASISCIGIGCTGPVDPVNGVVGNVANLPGWWGHRRPGDVCGSFCSFADGARTHLSV